MAAKDSRDRAGAMERLRRRGPALATAALTIVVFAASSVLASAVQTSVHATVDRNWRGLYDILVTARGQDFGAKDTDGLVEPNFVATSQLRGMTLSDLARIRGIANVAVAAPIGVVGVLRQTSYSPYLAIADNVKTGVSDLPGAKVLLRLTATLTAHPGQGDQVLTSNSGEVVLDHRTSEAAIQSTATPSTTNDFGADQTDQAYLVQLGVMPSFQTTIIAVDPVAEAQLRGKAGSAFLDPFTGLPSSRTLSGDDGSWSGLLNASKYEVQQADIEQLESGQTTSYAVPMIVNTQALAPLSLTVTSSAAVLPDAVAPLTASDVTDLAKTANFGATRTETINATSLAVPFTSSEVAVAWPNSHLSNPHLGALSLPATDLATGLVGRPAYTATTTSDGKLGYEVVPTGTVSADGSPWSVSSTLGSHQQKSTAFRKIITDAGPGFAEAAPVPVGTFIPGDLADPDAQKAGYTPTGIAGSTTATLTTLPDGKAADVPVDPQYNGLDFLTAAPGAITDLAGGEQLRGSAPIDAIRVRVAGVSSYTPANVAKINAVAAQISAAGFDARVVAGSSLQPVDVDVTHYWTNRTGSGDLGWVRQEWTSLGAAVKVTSGLTGATGALVAGVLAISAAGELLLAAFVGLSRRAEVEVLTSIGWRRRRIRASLVGRDLGGTALVVIAIVVGTVLLGTVSVLPAAVLGLATIGGTAVAVATAMSKPPAHARGGGSNRPVSGVLSVAARTVRSHPGWLALNAAAGRIIAIIIALAGRSLSTSLASIGDSRLAFLAAAGAAPWLVTLAIAGVLFISVLQRRAIAAESSLRRGQHAALELLGYARRTQLSIRRWQRLLTLGTVTGVMLGAGTVLALLLPIWAAGAGVIGAAIVTAVSYLTSGGNR